MTDKKQIKGLLDYISLKPGEEAEYAQIQKIMYLEWVLVRLKKRVI